MEEIDKVALIHLREGKILTARSKGKEKYYIPGGKREHGESDEQCLAREVKEELGVEVDISDAKYLGVFRAQADGMAAGIEVKMTCYQADLLGDPTANSEIEDLKWLNHKDKELTSHVDKIIFDYLKGSKQLL